MSNTTRKAIEHKEALPTKPQREIEKGIPLCDWHKPSEDSQLIGRMEIGDSVLFDCSPQNLRALASRHYGKKFSIRRVDDGIRIWRVE